MMYLVRRVSPGSPTPLHAFQDVPVGDGEPPIAPHQLYCDFLSPMSLPAELYLQTVRALFRDDALPRGRMRWRGVPVDLSAIQDTGLMTVEVGATTFPDGVRPGWPTISAHGSRPGGASIMKSRTSATSACSMAVAG
jgi:hypothetical protein